MVSDNPAENRTDVFVPRAWLVSPIVTTTYTARPGEFVRVNAHGLVTIMLPPAARNVGAEILVKEVAGEERRRSRSSRARASGSRGPGPPVSRSVW